MVIAYILQYKYKPFVSPDLNYVEETSIVASAITIYCGLYYLSGALNYGGKIFFFILILIVNGYFIVVWLIAFTSNSVSEFLQKQGILAKIALKLAIEKPLTSSTPSFLPSSYD
jgi:hypothetical protein